MFMVVGTRSYKWVGKSTPRLYAYWMRLCLTSGRYWELAGLIKQFAASWLSMPWPKGAQYSQTLPLLPPALVLLLAVSLMGWRGTFGASGAGAVGGIKGTYVSLSRASATTSVHVSVVPYNVTLAFLTCSKSYCIA